MIDDEETGEWRKPTDEELEVVRRNTKIFAEHYMGMAKSVGICAAIALGVTAYCVYFLIRYGGTEPLAAVIVLAVIDLCFLISILRKRSKARFILKAAMKVLCGLEMLLSWISDALHPEGISIMRLTISMLISITLTALMKIPTDLTLSQLISIRSCIKATDSLT